MGCQCSCQSAIQRLILGCLWLKLFFSDTFLHFNVCLFVFKFLLILAPRTISRNRRLVYYFLDKSLLESLQQIHVKIDLFFVRGSPTVVHLSDAITRPGKLNYELLVRLFTAQDAGLV